MLADLAKYTEPLARTPAILRAAIQGQPDSWLDSRHDPEVVSPREAVAHLVLCERESWVTRIQRVLHPNQVFPRHPSSEMDDPDLLAICTVDELLDEFAILRPQKIQELTALNLSVSDLQIQAQSKLLGPYTVGNLIATWAAHDLYHLGQIFKSYSAVYKDDIGGWQHYLNLPHFN